MFLKVCSSFSRDFGGSVGIRDPCLFGSSDLSAPQSSELCDCECHG